MYNCTLIVTPQILSLNIYLFIFIYVIKSKTPYTEIIIRIINKQYIEK